MPAEKHIGGWGGGGSKNKHGRLTRWLLEKGNVKKNSLQNAIVTFFFFNASEVNTGTRSVEILAKRILAI